MSQATAARPAPVRRAPRGVNPTATRARLKLVQPTQAAQTGVGFVVLCATLVVGGLITVLLLNTARAQQQYTISDLQNASSRLSATQQDLDTRLAYARAPQQLALKAQEYGMVPATNLRFVRASDHRLVGVAKGAAPTAPFTVSTLPKTPATPMANLSVTSADTARLVEKPKPATQDKPKAADTKKDAAKTDSTTKTDAKSSTPSKATTGATTDAKSGQSATSKQNSTQTKKTTSPMTSAR